MSKLLGPQKWTSFHLYVLLDIVSRYVVGWMVATVESAALARKLIGDSCERQKIQPQQLVVHADRGSLDDLEVVGAAPGGFGRDHEPGVGQGPPGAPGHPPRSLRSGAYRTPCLYEQGSDVRSEQS